METEKDAFRKKVVELDYILNGKNLNRAFIAYKKLRRKLVGGSPLVSTGCSGGR